MKRAERKTVRPAAALSSGAVLTLGVAIVAAPAQAATFTVTNLNDAGAGSLRQAVLNANTGGGLDFIDFQIGLTGTITLTSGELAITDSVEIQGPGPGTISVNGNNSSRIFYLYNPSFRLDATISGLTLTGGNAADGGAIYDYNENLILDDVVITGNTATNNGGGLWADGFNFSLTIQDSVLSGNSAVNGGAIYVEDTGGPLVIRNTQIAGNDASNNGGGIYFYDPDLSVTLDQVTISGNTADNRGGGIYFYYAYGGTVTLQNTTISGNQAAQGGGIYLYRSDDPVVIENSTISGNTASDHGGGLSMYAPTADLDIRHSTIAGNSATNEGGGIFLSQYSVTIDQSIVANNTAPSGGDLGGGGGFAVRFSLIENPGGAGIINSGGNILGQDPQLGPLTSNGGPTQTHLPASMSPAINAGDPNFVPPPSNDQRGTGFPRVAGPRIDIGAVERGVPTGGTLQFSVTAYAVNEDGITATITVTRAGSSTGAVSVDYQASDGSANQPSDYLPAFGTLNWANGDTAPKTFQITIVDDLLVEGNETVNLTLSNAQGGAEIASPFTAVLTIVDNDREIPALGDFGKILFAGLCGLAALLALRKPAPRRRFAGFLLHGLEVREHARKTRRRRNEMHQCDGDRSDAKKLRAVQRRTSEHQPVDRELRKDQDHQGAGNPVAGRQSQQHRIREEQLRELISAMTGAR